MLKTTITMIQPEQREWPEHFRAIRWPSDRPQPARLYVESLGEPNWQLLHQWAIGFAGPRACTPYGLSVIQKTVKDLAQLPVPPVIVSGLCPGVDERAHETALAYGIPTIAVLPFMGFARLRSLGERILAAGGLIISENKTESGSLKEAFTQRNGILTGLSNLLIVPQCEERSGTANSIRQALWQQIPVWCPLQVSEDARNHPTLYAHIRTLLKDHLITGYTLPLKREVIEEILK